jgi:hypothetical protein
MRRVKFFVNSSAGKKQFVQAINGTTDDQIKIAARWVLDQCRIDAEQAGESVYYTGYRCVTQFYPDPPGTATAPPTESKPLPPAMSGKERAERMIEENRKLVQQRMAQARGYVFPERS